MSDSQASDSNSVERGREQERVLERFEEAWVAGSVPDIRSFLGDPSTADGRGLITELIQVDLERRWRSSAAELGTGSADGLAMRPWVEDYLSIADLTDLPHESLLELLRSEFQVRHRWGDRPNV